MWPFTGSLETSNSGDHPRQSGAQFARHPCGQCLPPSGLWSNYPCVEPRTGASGDWRGVQFLSGRADGSPLQFDSDRSHRLKRLNKTSLYDTARLRQVGRRSALNPAIIIINRWLAAAGIIQVAPCHRRRRAAETSLPECPAGGEHVSTYEPRLLEQAVANRCAAW